ncbi:pyruvate, water dikinase regulatory protein [Eremococcus coleocola]|uniref:pyruvate, water dikinase regulatory protein n=1 Tax=Eremococcus coleocola TaxID=88132 RepID=UPI0031F62154
MDEIRRFPFVRDSQTLIPILEDALKEQAIVITTLVSDQLNQMVEEFCTLHGLDHVDYISPLMRIISRRTQLKPTRQSGSIHAMNKNYFDRVDAIEFAVKFDDGRSPRGFLESDLVLLGVSRTSKTPLSIYLANNNSLKVSNLPLVPEITLPKEIFQVPKEKLIGLIASPRYIMRIRQERVKVLGLGQGSAYDDLSRIKSELLYAQKIYDQLGIPVVNIENKSIEETVVHIEAILNQYQ